MIAGITIHPKLFSVQKINKLVDKYGLESFQDIVSVGDVLISVDGIALVPVLDVIYSPRLKANSFQTFAFKMIINIRINNNLHHPSGGRRCFHNSW